MSLLDRIKERASPDMSDDELNAMIAGIVAEISARVGPVGTVTAHLGDLSAPEDANFRTLKLNLPADLTQPIVVAECNPGNSGAAAAQLLLTAADFRILHGGRTLQRLNSGPNPAEFWAPSVTATYTATGPAQAQRDEIVIKLMLIDLSYKGLLKSERAGDYQWTGSTDSYTGERDALLSGLGNPSGGMVFA
jgi:hypothetical protein